jgi:hypothetical protein
MEEINKCSEVGVTKVNFEFLCRADGTTLADG